MSTPETITANDLLDALAAADALETFCQLPPEDQAYFSRWIGQARNDESHWHRIGALVMAISAGPLGVPTSPGTVIEPESPGMISASRDPSDSRGH